jgi:hypothetical protein
MIKFFKSMMSTSSSLLAWYKQMEIPSSKVICIVNGIGDESQKLRLCKLKQSLNISMTDFSTYLGEARTEGIIKFDPWLVSELSKNNPSEWEFLKGPIIAKKV